MRDSDYIASIWLKVKHSHPSSLVGKQMIEIQDKWEPTQSMSIAMRAAFELGFSLCLDRIYDLHERTKKEEESNA